MMNHKLITDALNVHRCDTVDELINILRTADTKIIAENYYLLSNCYHYQKYYVLALKYAKLAVQVEIYNSSYWLHYLKVSFSLQSEAITKSIYKQTLHTELDKQNLITRTYKARKFISEDEKSLIDEGILLQLNKLL